MVTEPTREQAAEGILWIVVHQLGRGADTLVSKHEISQYWRATGWDMSELVEGLEHALGQGWLVYAGPTGTQFTLSGAGYDNAPSSLSEIE